MKWMMRCLLLVPFVAATGCIIIEEPYYDDPPAGYPLPYQSTPPAYSTAEPPRAGVVSAVPAVVTVGNTAPVQTREPPR